MCNNCNWQDMQIYIEDLLEKIDELDSSDYKNSIDNTCRNILEWVSAKRHITEGQERAILNIEKGLDQWKR